MKVPKRKLADRLHHGVVWTCMGITLLGIINIGFRGFEYVMYVRPARKAEEARIEQQLLMEGRGFVNSASEELTS